jgi:two-component system, NarL family, sensor histidine kinase DesK
MTLWPTPLAGEPGHYRGMSAFTALWNGRGRDPGPSPAPPSEATARPGGVAQAEQDWRATDPYMSPRAQRIRRTILLIFITYFVVWPMGVESWRKPTSLSFFLLAGTVAFTAIVFRVFSGGYLWDHAQARRVLWIWLPAALSLGIALFVVGELHKSTSNAGGWVVVLTIAAAVCGRFTASVWPAVIGASLCIISGLAVADAVSWKNQGQLIAVLLTPLLATFLAYTAGKRLETVARLRQTRAELARIAVAEERLRIARDLHDLLGHSLSLITLKAELSRRMITTDTERATHELAELEAVARQSLSDVREAVAGYRQPDLAAELAAARQLLTAAGIAVRIETPETLSLPGDVDAALAWTVREGVTNVVRHSGAGRATIAVTTCRAGAVAEITDDGAQSGAFPKQRSLPPVPRPASSAPSALAGAADPAQGAVAVAAPAAEPTVEPGYTWPRRTGSGLAGLGERVRQLGGELAAGPVPPAGFRLRVTIPLGPGSD